MDIEKSFKLADSTSEEQKNKCEHNYETEYKFGSKTGDLVCTRCGHQVWKESYLKNQKD